MSTHSYQSSFNVVLVPAPPPVPTEFGFDGPARIVRRLNKLAQVEEFSPIVPPAVLVIVPGLQNLEGASFRKNSSRKLEFDTIFYPRNIAVIPPLPIHTGTYEEVFDFGIVVNNVILNLSWSTINIAGSVSVQTFIRTSNDGSSWSGYVAGPSTFFNSLRFADVLMVFTGADNKSAIEISNLTCTLNIKFDTDQGSLTVNSGD